MTDSILDNQRKHYSENFSKYGSTPLGTYQNNIETQYLRFDRLIRNIRKDLLNCRIHDIGSGTCDFHRFLLENNINHEYYGTEIVQEMIDFSLLEYPDIKLYNRDLLSVSDEMYDFNVLSGTLNISHELDKKAWREYSYKLIEKMFALCSKGIAFNFLTSYNTFSKEDLVYFDPGEILSFCIKKLSRFVIIDHAYPLYEATCTVFKKQFIRKDYKRKAFDKYFVH
jgi:hypothetical protein